MALSLDGSLEVSLLGGFSPAAGMSFDIFDWNSLSGTFSSIALPTLAGGLTWDTSDLYTTGELSVSGLPGDFDLDGDVDGRDFLLWQRGESPMSLSASDLADWQGNYGVGALLAAAVSSVTGAAPVPEPGPAILLATTAIFLVFPIRFTRIGLR